MYHARYHVGNHELPVSISFCLLQQICGDPPVSFDHHYSTHVILPCLYQDLLPSIFLANSNLPTFRMTCLPKLQLSSNFYQLMQSPFNVFLFRMDLVSVGYGGEL